MKYKKATKKVIDALYKSMLNNPGYIADSNDFILQSFYHWWFDRIDVMIGLLERHVKESTGLKKNSKKFKLRMNELIKEYNSVMKNWQIKEVK